MYFLSVQGAHASSFQFRNKSGHEFRSFVESLVLNHVTVICSKFRTDIIYVAEEDYQEKIMKAWCRVVGKEFSPEIRRKFLRFSDRKETLENYFISLIYLTRMPVWFDQYRQQVNLTIDQEPDHPIHKLIINCARYLAKGGVSLDLSLTDADKHSIAYFLLKNTKTFALEAARDYNSN